MGKEQTTLTNIARGMASELFARELEQVKNNIGDSRTSARVTRKITLEITFKPDETRSTIETSVKATSHLAPMSEIKGLVFASRDGDEIAFTNNDPTQFTLAQQLAEKQAKNGERKVSNGN